MSAAPMIFAKYACDGPNVIIRHPLLLYNVDHDSKESFPLNLKKYKDIVHEIESRLKIHKASYKLVSNGLVNTPPTNTLMPCCNPPSCVCLR